MVGSAERRSISTASSEFEVPVDETFGSVLKDIRETRNISQNKLAIVAGFDHSTISRFETGDRVPVRDSVDALANALEADDLGRARLLKAAGFFVDVSILLRLDGQHEMAELYDLLDDNDVPKNEKASAREVVRSTGALLGKSAVRDNVTIVLDTDG